MPTAFPENLITININPNVLHRKEGAEGGDEVGHFLPSLALDFSVNNPPCRNIISTLIIIITNLHAWGWLLRLPSSCIIVCRLPMLANNRIQVSSTGSTRILLNSRIQAKGPNSWANEMPTLACYAPLTLSPFAYSARRAVAGARRRRRWRLQSRWPAITSPPSLPCLCIRLPLSLLFRE